MFTIFFELSIHTLLTKDMAVGETPKAKLKNQKERSFSKQRQIIHSGGKWL